MVLTELLTSRDAVDDDLWKEFTERRFDRAAEVVRPGGALIYATCSSEPEENEQVVAGFLDTHLSFEQLAPAMSTRPDRDGLDAFFVAVLVRRERA